MSSLLTLIRLPDLSPLPPSSPGGTEAQGGCLDGEGGAHAGRPGKNKSYPLAGILERKWESGACFKSHKIHNASPLASGGIQFNVENRKVVGGGFGVQRIGNGIGLLTAGGVHPIPQS